MLANILPIFPNHALCHLRKMLANLLMSTMQGFVFLQVSYREVRQQQHFKLCLANIAKTPQQKNKKWCSKEEAERESAGLECTTKTSDYLS